MTDTGNRFEIGLVMAGAVSAGAYTAGVFDFLIQALDAWYAERAGSGDVPRHEVHLKVLSGASAGGMTAAIAASALRSRFRPVSSLSDIDPANKLFESWVTSIDIQSLLETADLERDGQLRSLLDSSVLARIAQRALATPSELAPRAYVASPLHVLLTVANLRGVPYSIPFQGESTAGHEMLLHADYLHFVAGDQPSANGGGVLPLDWRGTSPAWGQLGQAAIASGAFPVGLAPRLLSRDLSASDNAYTARYRTRVDPGSENTGERDIAPRWFGERAPSPYEFLCVDGGLLDNEPLELARRQLAGSSGSNPRDGHTASRAVIMIDPFPGSIPADAQYAPGERLTDVIPGVLGALLDQARFKPEELALAQNQNVYSRFLIAPTRTPAAGRSQRHLASGALGGFGGFLSRAFRTHDFMLGRRNCQRFLEKQFLLRVDNPLFDGWTQGRERHLVRRGDVDHLPIIPLCGSARITVPQLDWPRYDTRELARLRDALEHRYDAVSRALLEQWFHGLPRRVAGLAARGVRHRILGAALGRIQAELKSFELLSGAPS